MEDENVVPAAAGRKTLTKILRIVQWIVAVSVGVIPLIMLTDLSRLGMPGAPVMLFCVVEASMLGLAVLLSPPVFFRFSGKIKASVYAGILAGLFSLGTYAGQMQAAYERTPEGAKEAAEKRKWDAQFATWDAQLAESEKTLKTFEDAKEADLATHSKVKGCLSWFGHFAPLEDEVKGRLHNPDAFKHVKTEAIGPALDGDNLQMTFRAENGFGAVRTLTVRAKVNPDTCALGSAGEPTVN